MLVISKRCPIWLLSHLVGKLRQLRNKAMRSHGLKISVAKPSQFAREPSETWPFQTGGTFNPHIHTLSCGGKPYLDPIFCKQNHAKPCKTMILDKLPARTAQGGGGSFKDRNPLAIYDG